MPSLRLLLLLAIHRSCPFVPSLRPLLLVIHRSCPFVPSLSLLLLLIIHRSRPFVPSLSTLPLLIRRSRPFVRPTNVNPAWHCCNIQTLERRKMQNAVAGVAKNSKFCPWSSSSIDFVGACLLILRSQICSWRWCLIFSSSLCKTRRGGIGDGGIMCYKSLLSSCSRATSANPSASSSSSLQELTFTAMFPIIAASMGMEMYEEGDD